jgi:hypothetical protein
MTRPSTLRVPVVIIKRQLAIRSAHAETASAMVLRWLADENPETFLRGLRSWSPSSSQRISIAGESP